MLDEMTQTTVDAGGEFLEHYGVKGMKWGYRKDRKRQTVRFGGAKRTGSGGSASGAASKKTGSTRQWRKSTMTPENTMRAISAAQPGMRSDMKRLNAKFGGRINTKKERRAYNKEATALQAKRIDAAAKKVMGKSPDGKHTVEATIASDGILVLKQVRVGAKPAGTLKSEFRSPTNQLTGTLSALMKAPAHIERNLVQSDLGDDPGDGFEITIELLMDENEMYTGEAKFKDLTGGTLEQSAVEAGGDFLAHYGVKGMKWGHRMSEAERNARRRAKDERRSKARLRREDRRDRRQAARLDRKKTEAQIKAEAKAQAKIEKARGRSAKELAEATRPRQNGSNQGPQIDGSDIVGKSKRESKKLRKEAQKDRRSLKDSDIEAYTKRLQKERQMKDLITQDTAPKRAATNDFVKSVGKTVLTTAAVAAGSYAVGAALNKGGWPDLAKAASGGKWKPGDAKDSIDKATKTAKDTPIDLGKYKLPPDTFPKRPPAPFPPPPTYKPPKTRLPPPPPPPPPKRLLAPDGKPFRR